MKHMFKLAISAMSAIVFFCTTVFAAELSYTVNYGGGSSDITLSGVSAVAKAGRSITLQVIKEGRELTDIDYSVPSSAEDVILYTRRVLTDADGIFNFTFNIDQTGKHKIRISDNGETVDDNGTICISTNDALADALGDISGAKGNTALADTIINGDSDITPGTKVYDILQINKPEYDSLKSDSAFLSNLFSKEYSSLDAFHAQYNLSKLLVDISNAPDGEAIKNLLDADSSLIAFNTKNAGNVYEEYSDSEKISALDNLAGNHYSSVEAVRNALYETVIVNEIAAADTYQAKYDVISENNDYIDLDLSKCSNLGTYIESFKDELVKKDLSTVSKIKSAFDEVYLKYYKLKNSNQSGAGGGGSRPGSSSSGSSSVSSIVSVDTNLVNGPQSAFNDIYSVSWATEAIETLASKGVISGKSAGVFAPNDNITRAEFVKILIGAFDLNNTSSKAVFTDVPETHWAYTYIASASSKGIVNGIGGGMFGTDMTITRQDIVTLCYRLATSLGASFDASGEFSDQSQIADYAKEAAGCLKAAGVINGREDNRFDPAAFATRAEAAKIIYQIMLYCQK